jgi:hypothetical protein
MPTSHKSDDWPLPHDVLCIFIPTKHCTGCQFYARNFGLNISDKNVCLFCHNYPDDWPLPHDVLCIFISTKHCTGCQFYARNFGFNISDKNVCLFCPNYPACQSLLCDYVILISSAISLSFWFYHISCKYVVTCIIL